MLSTLAILRSISTVGVGGMEMLINKLLGHIQLSVVIPSYSSIEITPIMRRRPTG